MHRGRGIHFARYAANAAGDIDDAGASRGFLQQREQGLGQDVGACGVGVERGAQLFAVCAGGEGDGGVVDENVEFAVILLDGAGGAIDGGVVGEIEGEQLRCAGETARLQFLERGATFFRAARA